MLKRLILGLLIGLIMGSLVAALLVKGMGLPEFGGSFLACFFAAVTGVVVGLVAGKPIWAQGGKIEAGLKAVAGAVVGAGAMFAIRQWLHTQVDLSQFAAGQSELGNLPAVSLPLIAAVLGAFYEVDNTPEGDAGGSDAKKTKDAGKPAAKGKVRVASADAEEAEEEAEAPPKRAKR
jgi:hypothetical protein